VEMQYGDFVSDAELVGGCTSRRERDGDASGTDDDGSSTSRSTPRSKKTSLAQTIIQDLLEDSDPDLAEEVKASRSKSFSTNDGLCAINMDYCRTLQLRKSLADTDWRGRNREAITERSVRNSVSNPFNRKVPDSSFMEGVEVFTYSGQKLNSAELQKRALRKKMAAQEKDELWTYSEDKNTGCFPLLEDDIDLANVLRAADPNYKDKREPWRYPRTRPRSEYAKPDRDVSDARKEDLKEAWDEPIARQALKAGVVHNAFDAKSMGIGGAHVIELRKPGTQKIEGAAPLPPTAFENVETPRCPRIQDKAMRFPHQNNMGSMNMVDKYHSQCLEGKPQSKGLNFASRRVSQLLCTKYGDSMHHNPGNCEAAPVSTQVDEDYRQEPRNSLFSSHLSRLCAKDLVCKPPLSARDKRMQEAESNKVCGTLATWQQPCLSGRTKTFQKPAFVPQAVSHSALSAR